MRDRLIELLRDVDNMRLMRKGFSECADYFLENGVIVPPCKSGSDVWMKVGGFDKPLQGRVGSIRVYKDGMILQCMSNDFYVREYTDEDFGKVIFPTKEEAEQALKGGVQE